MLRRLARYFLLAWVFPFLLFSNANAIVPNLTGHVIDQTGTLTREQHDYLEHLLTNFESKKGSQVVVLIISSTQPETIEQFGIKVADRWKVGRNKIDDGVILLVAKNDHALRIEVGYGLEGVLSDVVSKRIIANVIIPHFKQQDFYGGIMAGVVSIIGTIEGENLPSPAGNVSNNSDMFGQLIPFLFIITLGVGGIVSRILGKVLGSLVTGSFVALIAWFGLGALSLAAMAGFIAFIVTLIAGGVGRSGFGGFYSGGTGGGGFSGGGGGFGGGGASGRW